MTFQPPESDDYTFTEWLDSTTELQVKAYGIDPYELYQEVVVGSPNSGYYAREQVEERLANFIRWNILAAENELHEFLNECPIWKPWSTSTDINRDAAIGEMVDVLHFCANLLRLLGVSGTELTERYKAKQLKNAERMRVGYDGVKEKCPGCKRDKDEVGATSIPIDNFGGATVGCAACGTRW